MLRKRSRSPLRTAIAATIRGDLQAVLIRFTLAQIAAFLMGCLSRFRSRGTGTAPTIDK